MIGDLAVLKDRYTTSEGRDVALEIYAIEKDIPKCHIAMEALKHSMRWDEEHYGRAYDLDNYMIVAVSQFNMGAMENKGLNIFNTSCVLADEEYTTDAAIMRVQSVIAHEYFHNWTGNRITCRDWFQLCLKELYSVINLSRKIYNLLRFNVLTMSLFLNHINSQKMQVHCRTHHAQTTL